MSAEDLLLPYVETRPAVRFERCLVNDEVLLGISTTVDTSVRPGMARVVLSGELCPATAPTLAAVLDDVTSHEIATIQVDLSAVSFCTSHGVDLLDDARHRMKDGSGNVELVGAHGVVRRVLEASGVPVRLVDSPGQSGT